MTPKNVQRCFYWFFYLGYLVSCGLTGSNLRQVYEHPTDLGWWFSLFTGLICAVIWWRGVHMVRKDMARD